MFPGAIVPLQHDLAGRIVRIQVHVSVEEVARADRQSGRRIIEEMLVRAGGNH